MAKTEPQYIQPYRAHVIYSLMLVGMLVLGWRAVDLQVVNQSFLQDQGDARTLRQVSLPAHRGMILDRNGEPLAISTPVASIWANPSAVDIHHRQMGNLAKLLKTSSQQLTKKISSRQHKEFVYLKRQITPALAQQIDQLNIPGVYLQREYRRYYPNGELFGHVLGFTNIDDHGQEGIELAYNEWLRGVSGAKRVTKDRLGHIISVEEQLKSPEPGKDLQLSLDKRLQYLAYLELKKAVTENGAKTGSAVILDSKTGEVLAMVNQPGFNPNRGSDRQSHLYRNRAVTDVFEPGSTMKPLAIAAALDSGKFKPSTKVETGDGWMMIDGKTIKDTRAYGTIDVSTVLQKSSNVGTSKIALALEEELLWDTFADFGFGQDTGSGFPGEATGRLVKPRKVHPIEQATLSFGYGVTVTALQLAQGYAQLANEGVAKPISFVKQDNESTDAASVLTKQAQLSTQTLSQVNRMMERVVEPGGTATKAAVEGYRVAGKTGTVKKTSRSGGYTEDKYMAVFAGFAPASDPRLVMVVMVDEPSNGVYYGGEVAGPVFSNVMAGALRLMDIPPDKINPGNVAMQLEALVIKAPNADPPGGQG